MTIDTNLIEIILTLILVALIFLRNFIAVREYKKGFDDGLEIGKIIGKSDAMSEVEDGNDD